MMLYVVNINETCNAIQTRHLSCQIKNVILFFFVLFQVDNCTWITFLYWTSQYRYMFLLMVLLKCCNRSTISGKVTLLGTSLLIIFESYFYFIFRHNFTFLNALPPAILTFDYEEISQYIPALFITEKPVRKCIVSWKKKTAFVKCLFTFVKCSHTNDWNI